MSERTARNYMSLAAHFEDKTANFADLDLGTARDLIDAPAEVSGPIMRRAEASQEEVKAAVRISRVDCAPVTLPRSPAIELVSVSQSWFAEPPTKEPPPRVDLREAGEKSAGRNIAHDLKDLAFQLRRFQSADKLVERLQFDEPEDDVPVALAGPAALMRSTRAALTWINHWPRSRRIGYRVAPFGSVEAMAS